MKSRIFTAQLQGNVSEGEGQLLGGVGAFFVVSHVSTGILHSFVKTIQGHSVAPFRRICSLGSYPFSRTVSPHSSKTSDGDVAWLSSPERSSQEPIDGG
jgi:hypothetical protein